MVSETSKLRWKRKAQKAGKLASAGARSAKAIAKNRASKVSPALSRLKTKARVASGYNYAPSTSKRPKARPSATELATSRARSYTKSLSSSEKARKAKVASKQYD